MQNQKSRQARALEILQNPELFPALAERNEFDRLICLWRIPSFGPHSSWSVYRDRKTDKNFVRRLEYDPKRGLHAQVSDPHIFGCEAPMNTQKANEVVQQFESLTIPVFCRPAWAGLDGESFGAHMGNFWQSTTVNWWSHFSPEWKPLNDLFHDTVTQLEALLPASTLREIER